MSAENDTTEGLVVQATDDAKSEVTEEFVVLDNEDVPDLAAVSVIDLPIRKTAKVVVGESEDDDEEDEEVPQGEDGDFLAEYPDDTEVCLGLSFTMYTTHHVLRNLNSCTHASPHAHH